MKGRARTQIAGPIGSSGERLKRSYRAATKILGDNAWWHGICRSCPGMKGNLNVVVVEDDADYAFFIGQAFRNKGFANLAMICGDGEEAADYLDGKGEFADRRVFPFPDVLFTD